MRIPLSLLALVTVVHLSAQLAGWATISGVSQVLLMPLLGWALFAGSRAPRSRLIVLVMVALGFSWLGDTLPRLVDPDTGFLLMVGAFLVAQIFYIAAFAPAWGTSVVAAMPIMTLPYFVAYGALVALCFEGAGALLIPVLVYGAALTAMAVLATGLGRTVGVGGAIFMLSDSLIALRAFTELSLPANGFWVMLTYVLGQTLIVLGVLRVRVTTGIGYVDGFKGDHPK
ncbi:MAG TPA: lysoplasmalogenase [Marmoricola sp.]|nr:lysoplasmalogenase [Marmoricola sp.]HNM96537.1 lysoplasmalogenase [Marmoricola sp.]